MFRRNQIVHTASYREGCEPEFVMFGRIVKKIDEAHYLVVSNGKNLEILPVTHLKEALDYDGTPYKGYWTSAASLYPDWKQEKFHTRFDETPKLSQHQVFVPMTSLRKLKQNAAYYHLVWRKQKKSRRDAWYDKYCAKLENNK